MQDGRSCPLDLIWRPRPLSPPNVDVTSLKMSSTVRTAATTCHRQLSVPLGFPNLNALIRPSRYRGMLCRSGRQNNFCSWQHSQRPGPPERVDRQIIAAVAEAAKASRMLDVSCQARGETEPRARRIALYGLLTESRRHQVASPHDELAGRPTSTWLKKYEALRSPQ